MVRPSEDFGQIEMALDEKKVPHPWFRRSKAFEASRKHVNMVRGGLTISAGAVERPRWSFHGRPRTRF